MVDLDVPYVKSPSCENHGKGILCIKRITCKLLIKRMKASKGLVQR